MKTTIHKIRQIALLVLPALMTAFLASLNAATISATTPTVPDLSSVSLAVGLTGSLPRNMPNNGKVGYGMFSLNNESVISVNGYGNYCSKTWPTGGSSFGYISNGGDPCAYIDPANTGTTRRKGLYSSFGWNNVILRCDQGIWFYTGVGNAPLDWAYAEAYGGRTGKSNCVFTVAPREMPIFGAPFYINYPAGSGFDFARYPYHTVDVTELGQNGSTAATIVNYKGQDKSGPTYINDHAGYDWAVPKNAPLRAVADGVVIRAEKYFKSLDDCNQFEAHVYLKHTVCGQNNYCEQFVSYYTHMNSVSVSVNQTVKKGDLIGYSGDSGCVPAHLHFTVARLTNTSRNLEEELVFTDQGTVTVRGVTMKRNVASNIFKWAIDPYGWEAPYIDPWGWKGYDLGLGAMSIKLWASGQVPSSGSW